MWMRPKRPLPTACLSNCKVRLRRFCLTTNKRTPASSQARTMARPSLQRVAIGFSVITSSPAAATSMTCCECRPLGVHSTTQSALLPANIAVSESKPCACVFCTAASSAAGSVSHTATSSACSPCWRMASKWFCAMRPQPANAKRNLRWLMAGRRSCMACVMGRSRGAWTAPRLPCSGGSPGQQRPSIIADGPRPRAAGRRPALRNSPTSA